MCPASTPRTLMSGVTFIGRWYRICLTRERNWSTSFCVLKRLDRRLAGVGPGRFYVLASCSE